MRFSSLLIGLKGVYERSPQPVQRQIFISSAGKQAESLLSFRGSEHGSRRNPPFQFSRFADEPSSFPWVRNRLSAIRLRRHIENNLFRKSRLLQIRPPFGRPRRSGAAWLPEEFILDNGPEATSRAMFNWSERTGVRLKYIGPGKPVQNAFV